MLTLSRVEMHLAESEGKQKIPTVIYSPLLYVSPAPEPAAPPQRSILPNVSSFIAVSYRPGDRFERVGWKSRIPRVDNINFKIK